LRIDIMRTYGLHKGKGKNFHCGWGCCFYKIGGVDQGFIVHGRRASVRNRLKRTMKRRERRYAKKEIAKEMKNMLDV